MREDVYLTEAELEREFGGRIAPGLKMLAVSSGTYVRDGDRWRRLDDEPIRP